jgi:branched-chain amino acid transport system permease protein
MNWVNVVVQGILLGGLYALFAAGLSLTFGVMRLVNLAHGDLSILAAFICFSISDTLEINPLLSLVLVLPAALLFGYLLQRIVIEHVPRFDVLPAIVVTFGIGIIIQNALLQEYSADNKRLAIGDLGTDTIKLSNQVSIGVMPLITFIAAIVVLGGLHLMLTRTQLGRAFRATSDDPDAVRLMGVDQRRTFARALAISIATVALAGVFLGIRTSFTPSAGPTRLIFAFEAVIIGGLGSLWGTLAGGIILGVAQAIGAEINPGWGVLTGHLVFLAVLVAKPTGLFGKVAAT